MPRQSGRREAGRRSKRGRHGEQETAERPKRVRNTGTAVNANGGRHDRSVAIPSVKRRRLSEGTATVAYVPSQ